MNSEEIFASALEYEKKNRDLYVSACKIVADKRGKEIFTSLAEDEQGHVDFLEYSIDVLKKQGEIDITKLISSMPSKELIQAKIEKMKEKIPEQILGDIKRVLNSALRFEIEAAEFYKDAFKKTEGPIQEIFKKFLVIEKRHQELVQIELDHVSNYGYWFDFMEIDLEG